MSFFSRQDVKRKARNPRPGGGFEWIGWLLLAAVIVVTLQNCGG
jgi:hypothetical protein